MLGLVLLGIVGRGHRNGERSCVHASVCPGFLIIILKIYHSINFKFGICILGVSVQN